MRKAQQSLLAVSFFLFIFCACRNYGDKLYIDGTKGEVFYKNGATRAEARALGNFLKKGKFFSDDKQASVQLSRHDGNYIVRFVYDKVYYEKTPGLENFFRKYAVRMSKELFENKKVDVILTEKYFNDFRTLPFDESLADSEFEPGVTVDDYVHETVGDVNYYWKDLDKAEARPIIDYISHGGFFSGGQAEIYMSKDGGRFVLKFPIRDEYLNDEGTVEQVEKISRELKDSVFPNDHFSFEMTDGHLRPARSFDY